MSIYRRAYKKSDGTTSSYYMAVAWLGNGQRLTKQFQRKIDAETWKVEQLHSHKSMGGVVSVEGTKTVRELSDYWLKNYAAKRKEGSSRIRDEIAFKKQILPYFGGSKLLELQPLMIEQWQQRLLDDQELAPKTVNNCLGLFKKMLSEAVRWRFIRYNPIREVRPLSLDEQDFDFWTPAEIRQFLTYAKGHSLPTYYAVGIAVYTGMRLGEIHGLQWDAVDLKNRYLTVKRTYCLKEGKLKQKTKTKRIRRIPINGSLLTLLKELHSKENGSEVLQGFDYEHAARNLRRMAEDAKVKPIRFHDLRHTFASNFLMIGGALYKLQRLLGHSTQQMTERYSHLSPDHLTGATELLDFEKEEE